MIARLLGALLALAILPGLAQAHGPTRQKVTETIEVAAPPAKVWARIQEFNDMSWHPRVAETEGAPGNVVDTARLVTLKTGGELAETLYRYDAAKMSYATLLPHVDVKVMPVTNYSAYLTVKPGKTPETSIVEYRCAFYRGDPNGDPPPELNEEAAIKAVTAFAKEGLEGIKKAVEQGS
ncbi:MxaD family protein [Aureimonas glaciei]|uniref:MxaD family protein n=1 Tax=Aureimonas glaciei TaxID=1776957 RepID=A0A917DGZ7_9HYPH|nr:SRPBCC family protein [Aureimonas glaciei]GGD36164.1 MxaD family protein [Aureimonas glaciei]